MFIIISLISTYKIIYYCIKLPKLELFAAANLCFSSLRVLLEEGRGRLLRLFKNCASPPNSNDPPVRQIIKIYKKKRKILE